MYHKIIVQPYGICESAEHGENLLQVLRKLHLAPEAPCGGKGSCGKCRVIRETDESREEVLACQTKIDEDMIVWIKERKETNILSSGTERACLLDPIEEGYLLAFDIGTTTVVCFLLDGKTGEELANASMLNPQAPFGADVISRIQSAQQGERENLTSLIREGMESLVCEVCTKAAVEAEEIGVVSVVANPCMQQLFMGMDVGNLAEVPFAPVLNKAEVRAASEYIPSCKNAGLLVIPDISGYVGADTLGCVLAADMDKVQENVLLVDIGTNGEMVLAVNGRMAACSTAAGPALEGAKIHFGMRGAPGAIDHVRLSDGNVISHVIQEKEAEGICGSGLIDAAAVMRKLGIINFRGRIQMGESIPSFAYGVEEQNGERIFRLTEKVYLTQQDIREVQMAKGAIAAGIELLAEYLGIKVEEIDRVLLAGAFGSFMDAQSACAIGLLPSCLRERISVIGNAAGSGAKILACSREELQHVQELADHISFLELASIPKFQRCFARNMNFE